MASTELIIDDDYCKTMGEYFVRQGEQIDGLVSEYVTILEEVKSNAIMSGEVSEALSTYIAYVKKLNKQMGNLSRMAKTQIDSFLVKVDEADRYLF